MSKSAHLASHPSAGLFELFAFGDALCSFLHILLRLLHPALNVVHKSTLNINGGRSQCPGGEGQKQAWTHILNHTKTCIVLQLFCLTDTVKHKKS